MEIRLCVERVRPSWKRPRSVLVVTARGTSTTVAFGRGVCSAFAAGVQVFHEAVLVVGGGEGLAFVDDAGAAEIGKAAFEQDHALFAGGLHGAGELRRFAFADEVGHGCVAA